MPYLYFCRHAQSIANAEGWAAGWRDVPLTTTGEQQAVQMALNLKKDGVGGGILTSDLKRAKHTAEIVSEILQLEVIIDDRIRERDYGQWTGRQVEKLRREEPEQFNYLIADLDFSPPDGETLRHHRDRVLRATVDAVDRWPDGFITVSHWGSIWVAVKHLYSIETPEIPKPPEYLGVTWCVQDIPVEIRKQVLRNKST